MNRLLCVIAIGSITSLLVAGSARAEFLNGKIAEINANTQTLTLVRVNPSTYKKEWLRVKVKGAQFKGIASLSDLKSGDELSVEAGQNIFTHEWSAKSIQHFETKPV